MGKGSFDVDWQIGDRVLVSSSTGGSSISGEVTGLCRDSLDDLQSIDVTPDSLKHIVWTFASNGANRWVTKLPVTSASYPIPTTVLPTTIDRLSVMIDVGKGTVRRVPQTTTCSNKWCARNADCGAPCWNCGTHNPESR